MSRRRWLVEDVGGAPVGQPRVCRRDFMLTSLMTMQEQVVAREGACRALPVVEIPPAPSRGGRPFLPKGEAELAEDLRVAAQRIRTPGAGLSVLVPEGTLPAGIPDLLIHRVRTDRLAARLMCPVPALLLPGDVLLVAACPTRTGADLSRLVATTGQTPERLRRRLRVLVEMGALHLVTGRWRSHPALRAVGLSYALEAKVADWRAGLWQALRYRTAADASGLVMGEVSKRVEQAAREAAVDLGVGLFARSRWLVRPRQEPHGVRTRLAVSEHLVAALRSNRSTHAATYQMLSASA